MILGKEKKIQIGDKVTKISPIIDKEVNYILYTYEYKNENIWSVFNEVHLKTCRPFMVFNNSLS